LAPHQHQEKLFKTMLGNCQSVVNSLGALRNKIGDAHGSGRRSIKPKPRHAELAVNLAGAMAEAWVFVARLAVAFQLLSALHAIFAKSAEVWLTKNNSKSITYEFRTKSAQSRGLEKNGHRERIWILRRCAAVRRFSR
jgi:hypothetical protein